MSDIHKEIRELWGKSAFTGRKLEFREADYRETSAAWDTTYDAHWVDEMDYRIISVTSGAVVMQSLGKRYTDQARPASTLTATDYADGCCKAALSLLMKPSREPEDIRKAHAWLGLALGRDK